MARCRVLCVLLVLIKIFCFSIVKAQLFTEVNPGKIKPSEFGFTSRCDINNDGYLDLFITGFNLVPDGKGGYIDFDHSMIYINDGVGSFNESNVKNIPRLIYGSSAWGDFNNDGWPDLIVTGTTSGFASEGITELYINTNGESFTRSSIQLPGIVDSETIWFDYNNDGWQDLFMIGVDRANNLIIRVLHNESGLNLRDSGINFHSTNGGRINLGDNDAIIGDFDNDMDQDIVVAQTSTGAAAIEVFENSGGSFQKKGNLFQYSYGTLAMADFNADGNLDIVVNGMPGHATDTFSGKADFMVMLGDGRLNFSLMKTFANLGSYRGSVNAGDVNNDGLPDIVINGARGASEYTNVFLNNGADFVHVNAGLFGSYFGESILGDFDNDGDLDLLITGSNGSATTAISRMYRNDSPARNERPSVPANIRVMFENNGVEVIWDKSEDDKTASNSISYNVRMGTQLNRNEIISGLTNPSGLRQVEYFGNTSLWNSVRASIGSGVFYFQVQAIDGAYHESEFSPIQTVCIISAPDVSYKNHYCYNEEIEIKASEGHIEVYEDVDLTKLIYSGSNYVAAATTSHILYVVQKASVECIRIPVIISLNVSEEPKLQFLANDQPLTASEEIWLNRCFTGQSFKLDLETNYRNKRMTTMEVTGETIYIHEPGAISIQIEDDYGCISEAAVSININNYSDLNIPNVITPNGDGKNDRFVLNSPSAIRVDITNRYGKTVFHSQNYNDNFDGHSLASGVYYYSLQIGACSTIKNGYLHIIH